MAKEDWYDIGLRLKALRVAKGIRSQTAMAKMIGAEVNQYNNWERGVANLPVDYAIRIILLTGGDLDYVYRGEMSGLSAQLIEKIGGTNL